MGMHPVCKVLALVTFYLLAIYHTHHDHACCHAALSPLTDPKRDGYSRLIRDIKNHSIVRDKVPPGITHSYMSTIPGENYFNTEAVNVSTQLMPVDILRLDPALQVLEMSAYIRLSWQDPILAWNMSEYGGVQMIEMSSSDLWTPTITVVNGVDNNDIIVDSGIPVCLDHLGNVSITFSVYLKTSCFFDLTFFPFDNQTCNITIAVTSLLGVHITPLTQFDTSTLLSSFSAAGEWSLDDIDLHAVPGFQGTRGLKNTLVTLHLSRKKLFYVMSVVVPMGLFTFMNCLVFLIPPESGEKISFVVSIFVSNTVFSSFVNGVMPRGLEWKSMIPLLMAYLAFMWVWSILTFLATAIVINRFHVEQANQSHRGSKTGFNRNQESNLLELCGSAPCSFPNRSIFIRKGKVAVSDDNRLVSLSEPVPTSQPSRAGTSEKTEIITPQQPDTEEVNERGIEKNKWRIKAKTLDRIFLVVSILADVSIKVSVIMYVYFFQPKL